jgi:hypothetical protein
MKYMILHSGKGLSPFPVMEYVDTLSGFAQPARHLAATTAVKPKNVHSLLGLTVRWRAARMTSEIVIL